MNAPWLFAEAYKYRRLRECFSLSKYWVDYGKRSRLRHTLSRKELMLIDVFFRQKCDTFSRSSQAVFELSTRFSQPHETEKGLSAEEQKSKTKLLFHELTQGASN